MRKGVLTAIVGCASLLAACDPEGGDPVQHALRDAAAARQAAALKTTEEEQAQAARRARSASPSASEDELSRLLAARRQAVEDTRALLAATTDPALRNELADDLKAEKERLRALEARSADGRLR